MTILSSRIFRVIWIAVLVSSTQSPLHIRAACELAIDAENLLILAAASESNYYKADVVLASSLVCARSSVSCSSEIINVGGLLYAVLGLASELNMRAAAEEWCVPTHTVH